MKKIPLNGKHGINKFALVDDEDYESVSKYKWFCHKSGYVAVAIRENRVSKTIYLHRFIGGFSGITDHIDGNKLNNQRSNLRECNHTENMMNRAKKSGVSVSKYKGVNLHRSRNYIRWRAEILAMGKRFTKICSSEYDAAKEYNKMALKYHGEFARLNAI